MMFVGLFADGKALGLRVVLAVCLCLLAVSVSGAWGFVEPGFTGQSSDFANCPVNVITSGVEVRPRGGGHCVHSVTTGGVVQIGHSIASISVPGDTFDAGGTEEEESLGVCAVLGVGECVIAPPHGIIHGPAQPVPAGLLGTVGNVQLTGVSAMVEWAAPVTPNAPFGTSTPCGSTPLVTFDLCKLLNSRSGTAVTLSVRIHLMSPFLGPNCYIGSAAHPIVIPLTTGLTEPPPPAKPIHGKSSEFFLPRLGALQLIGTTLVSNSFSVPAASGCGTTGGSLVDASIDHKLGLPSAAGLNSIVINANGEEHTGFEILEAGWKSE